VLRGTGPAGEVVVAQFVDIADAGLLSDLVEHRGGEHLGAEDGGDADFLDLPDEPGDILRRRVVEVRQLDGPDHRPAVFLGEVGIGVVIGQELGLEHGGRRRPDGRVEFVDPGGEGLA
jgi:hypothetical protein